VAEPSASRPPAEAPVKPEQTVPLAAQPEGLSPSLIVALLLSQMGIHASMAGMRMAAPLQALREGASTSAVGLVLALFAVAPVALAWQAGRMADRHGFHRPMTLASGLAGLGALLAVLSTLVDGTPHLVLLGLGALFSGAGANFGVLAIQRTAGLAARNATERVQLFSWLGVAPSLANVIGPVSVGLVIDAAGFRWAYVLVLLLPLLSLAAMRRVPRTTGAAAIGAAQAQPQAFWALLNLPGMRRLLAVNWLLAICWDVHTFAVPVLGHGFGFSASTIGFILGTFTLSVSLIRLAIPAMAHRLKPQVVVGGCMLGTALIYAAYPFASAAWVMAGLAALLGITLGSAQPMIMSTLHQLSPPGRHGEVLAVRSMAINTSSVLMPMAFGALGLVVGAGVLFWGVAVAVGLGSGLTRRLRVQA
jgi:MFS family permease